MTERNHLKGLGFYLFAGAILIYFGIFLFYPVYYIVREAFFPAGKLSLNLFGLLFQNPVTRESLINSLELGVIVTIFTSILALSLAVIFHRYNFPGKPWFSGLLLMPLIIPPFVGAIGIKQIFSRFGSFNLLLMNWGLMTDPIDWLGSAGFWGVVFLETLHLFPIMFLNLTASIANLDPVYDEAAQILGAGFFRRFRTVTLPLVLPGYFAGAVLVFLWAMTDLGTPLIFNFPRVIPMMIFNMITDIYANPMGYALVVFLLLFTATCFLLARRWAGSKSYELYGKGYSAPREVDLTKPLPGVPTHKRWLKISLIYLYLIGILGISALPHLGVLLNSLAGEWFMTVLPGRWTFEYYRGVFTHPLAFSSIRMSFFLSIATVIVSLILGVGIAYLTARKKIKGAFILDALTMLTLTVPGLVLAFGYIASFSGTIIDPRVNPVFLLVMAYGIRRLPYMVRSAHAGFSQSSKSLEEASESLGATPTRTFMKITLPLVLSHLMVGGLMVFAFSMLEVSDSIILAMQEKYYPITKTIWYLSGRPGDGLALASAMGMLGMFLLLASFLLAGRILGKKLGDIFRAG